jgi:hypothetical protein
MGKDGEANLQMAREDGPQRGTIRSVCQQPARRRAYGPATLIMGYQNNRDSEKGAVNKPDSQWGVFAEIPSRYFCHLSSCMLASLGFSNTPEA